MCACACARGLWCNCCWWFGDVVADVVVVVDAVTVGLVCSGVCVRMCVRRSVFQRPLENIILHAKRRMWPWLLNLVEIVV